MAKRAAPRIIAVDCETDPFLHGRVPSPFIWGAYDGATDQYWIFHSTDEFVAWLKQQDCIAYAHNGGKFDFMFLLPYVEDVTKARIIGGRFAEMKFGKATLRDSYSIVPVPLKEIQKDEISYELMEADKRAAHMPEIISYLKTDVLVLWLLVTRFREEAGTQLTIASNALKSSRALGANPGRTNFRFDSGEPEKNIKGMRDYYFGGRTECFQPGTHENLSIYDIRSSYPFAMSQEHPTGDKREYAKSLDGLSDDEIRKSFITLQCYSDGAFPLRTKTGLEFPRKFDIFSVTGHEYLTAKKHGLISNVRVEQVCTFEQTINFSVYVQKWYEHKEKHRPRRTIEEKAQYTIGKIMMNSLYGKLSQNPLRYYDYQICAPGTPVDDENGWEFYTLFQKQEIHRRSVQFNYKYKHGVDWVKKPLFYNVATGASITGLARANLLDAICAVGRSRVIYCDTDSMVLHGTEKPPLDLSERLGAWDCEGEGVIGHFAGKKLYAIRLKSGKEKIACKGCKLTFDNLHAIVNGEKVTWKSEAPTFSLASGVDFVTRDVRATSPVLKRK